MSMETVVDQVPDRKNKLDKLRLDLKFLKTEKPTLKDIIPLYLASVIVVVITIFVLLFLATLIPTPEGEEPRVISSYWRLGGGVLFLAMLISIPLAVFGFFMRIWSHSNQVSEAEIQLLRAVYPNAEDCLDEDTEILPSQGNFTLLSSYYRQAQNHSRQSFTLTCFMGVLGFVVILVGVAIAMFTEYEIGSIAATAGVVSEFIAAVFYYLYNKTQVSMAAYHQSLVRTQNQIYAVEIAEGLPPDEALIAKQNIINTLIGHEK